MKAREQVKVDMKQLQDITVQILVSVVRTEINATKEKRTLEKYKYHTTLMSTEKNHLLT